MLVEKKGISPVIATVLLIAIVIIIAVIIFIWAGKVIQEDITKFGSSIKTECGNVVLSASELSGTLSLSNGVGVAVSRVDLKMDDGSIVSCDSNSGVGSAESTTITLSSCGASGNVESVIPVLLGEKSDGSPAEYSCDKNAIIL